jgi:YihY family inner membrane protein
VAPSFPERRPGPVASAARAWVTLQEAGAAFVANSDLRHASSLAFYTTLALIPALFLLTFLLSLGIGSSQAAMQKTTELIHQVIPRFGDVILAEVRRLASHPGAAGSLNLLVFAWSLTPLVASLREIVGELFRVRSRRPLLATKALDLAIGMAFITGLAGVAGAGVVLKFLARFYRQLPVPASLDLAAPLALTVLLVWAVYFAFIPRMRKRHLLAGALVCTLLWFLMRPAFTLFLTHDQGYGFAFGSLKSVFIVVIWIYYSMAALLFGAEVIAALHRGEALVIKRLLEGRRGLPLADSRHLLLEVPAGWVFFEQDDPGQEMYFLLSGTVGIRRDGRELARIGKGSFFGEMTFLLDQERSAGAVALEPCRCVVVHGQNFEALLVEFPGIVRQMLVEMASRLREQSVAGR